MYHGITRQLPQSVKEQEISCAKRLYYTAMPVAATTIQIVKEMCVGKSFSESLDAVGDTFELVMEGNKEDFKNNIHKTAELLQKGGISKFGLLGILGWLPISLDKNFNE